MHINTSLTTDQQTNDIYMMRCLHLAGLGESYVAPNPLVGAVLVYDNKIIGEGYHERYGQAHAEPNAINSVQNKDLLKDATLYVSLEPCSHFGKTPPCANLIVSSNIKKVVIGTLDPNPKVSGNGVRILQEAGIEVVVGVLENECRELNKRFFIFQEEKRPFVLLKWAQTKDGFIDKIRTTASELPLQISNEITRKLTHKMRAENQSIFVSTNTVILDNPSLTVRNWTGKNPVRIALDRQGRIPENYNLFDGKVETLVFTEKAKKDKTNIAFIEIKFDENCIKTILDKLFERNINSVLIEGGATLLNSFIAAGVWDEANVEVSNQLINNGIPAPKLSSTPDKTKNYENHLWISYKNRHKQFKIK